MSSLFPTFDIASSALTTHQIWMNALADNIANINTVKPMSESAYQEKFIVAQEIPSEPGEPVGVGGGVAPVAVQYGDATGMVTYDPTNPLADKQGLVRRPSENLGDQMTNLIIAQRGYQLNLAVIDRAKSSYQQALDINGTVVMAVTPISGLMSAAGAGSIAPVTPTTTAATEASNSTGGVGNAFSQALDSLQGTQSAADSLAQAAATGNLTDIHNYTIAATQASLTTELTVAVRDRAVESFNEIMRMQV